MKVAIIGGRDFKDYSFLKNVCEKYEMVEIISGGAKGADSLAEKYAKEKNIQTKIFLPNWNKHGKAAGFIRNTEIVERADMVIAFWDGKSKGTDHSITIAEKMDKPVYIYRY